MQKEFVTYEIALKLKKLGFDEPCFALFDHNSEELYFEHNEEIKAPFDYSENSLKGTSYIIAPLWQQVIDWFREKYKLCIEIQCPQREFEFYSWTIHKQLSVESEEFLPATYEDGFTNCYYKSREQAILKAIELCQKEK